MMVETSDGTRIDIVKFVQSGGVGIYDNPDTNISGAFRFTTVELEIGAPVRFIWNDLPSTLPYGEIVNTVVVSHRLNPPEAA